jgi:hypothetical protein
VPGVVPAGPTRRLLLVGLVVIGCAAATFTSLAWSGSRAPSGGDRSATAPAAGPVVIVPAVEQYLAGMTGSDAQLMWDALAPGLIRTMQEKGASQGSLQKELDEAWAAGVRYEHTTLDTAYRLQSGDVYLFYTLTRRDDTRVRPDQIRLVLVVGGDGKIAEVSSSRPRELGVFSS